MLIFIQQLELYVSIKYICNMGENKDFNLDHWLTQLHEKADAKDLKIIEGEFEAHRDTKEYIMKARVYSRYKRGGRKPRVSENKK
jgi:hypothetical protein